MPIKIDSQYLITLLKTTAKELGRTPSRDEFTKKVKNGKNLVDEHFQSFRKLVEASGLGENNQEYVDIVPPFIPEDDLPVEDLIAEICKRFKKRNEAYTAKKWMTFKVKGDEPIGIMWFGDPHLDDDGCHWPLLMEHIDICKNTEGMYGANIGDVHNNWVGRLMKEYANQNTSRGTAFKLIEWFFKEAGIDWLIMLLGNHCDWNFGAETLQQIARNICPLVDWRAQFKLQFSNGRECLIDAAHNHAGHSQWNSLHGQQKASTIGGVAHLYIAGHLHNWALAQNECPHTNRIYWLARARGYKYIDSYADNHGFGSQKNGASIVTIIDPTAPDVNMVKCFADPKEGAQYLNFLRRRRKK